MHEGNFGGPRIDDSVFLSLEDALQHGHDAAKVKEAMFASLDGMA